ncbi:MAG: type IV secretory system conjugative DNA transfer family protein [Lachnospiraceae bacterium]|nr:type IV secretory system conjugative DNA transfer family protein [Lachnospiraceae bacterium]
MKRVKWSKVFQQAIPYIGFGYFGDVIGCAYRVTDAPDFFNRLLGALNNLSIVMKTVIISFHPFDLLIGVVFGGVLRAVVYFKGKNAKKFRKGEEYGSARWGTVKDIEPYMDLDNPDNNVILTQTEGLLMSGRPSSPKYARNKNILVIGGSGSGKTRFFVKPNIMQMHSSYVITDPKGTVLYEVGKMLEEGGYIIRVLNTINFSKSMHYNPFAYLRSEKDILKLVNTLIVNTKGEGQQATEDFWVKAERLLYTAYIGYIYYECVTEDQNFETLIDMINESETKEDDENFENAIDLIFKELEEEEADHFAVKQYKKYKLAAGVINCGGTPKQFTPTAA